MAEGVDRGPGTGRWQRSLCHLHSPALPRSCPFPPQETFVLCQHRLVVGAGEPETERAERETEAGDGRELCLQPWSFTFTAYSLLVMRLMQDWTLAWAPSPSTSSCSW